MSHYGECSCGGKLKPVWFKEEETKVVDGYMSYTGRIRNAVSHLSCELCLKNYVVDDSFDGRWYFAQGEIL